MASVSRAARCCIRSAPCLPLSRSTTPARLAHLSRGVATTSTPPSPILEKTTTTPTQKRPAPANRPPYHRRPASNAAAKSDSKSAVKPAPTPTPTPTPAPAPAPASATSNNKHKEPALQRQFEQNAVPGQAPLVPTFRSTKIQKDTITDQSPIKDMTEGLADTPSLDDGVPSNQVDWSSSFHGLSAQPFSKEAAEVLLADIEADDVEVKPDGIVYLPEIKYRRILNRAFGPGGWGLAPRGETIVTGKSVTREYALVAHGRLVSVARGEQQYFSPEGIPTATEGCKSNALMRCCKDLGVASELWDPRFIRKFMKSHAKQIWVEHVPTKKKKQIWLRIDDEPRYPFKETKFGA